MERSNLFTVLVVGDNPEELMSPYQIGLEAPKYIKYKYADAKKMRKNSIKVLTEIITDPQKFSLNDFHVNYFKEKIAHLNELSDFDYYREITDGLFYDENGDAWSDENLNGKWKTYSLGKNMFVPLQLKDGSETNQAKVSDIDWPKMHLANCHLYELAWDLAKGIIQPQNEQQKQIAQNMSKQENYLSNFKTKEDYVLHNCAYWNYAFLNDKGWSDIDNSDDPNKWVATFYDKFIANLTENSTITIYECSK